MATLDSLFERVWDEMPSVTESIAMRALADSVKEFCVRTHYWITPVTAVPALDASHYILVPPEGLAVVAAVAVRRGGKWIHPGDGYVSRWGVRTGTYMQRTPSLIELEAATTEEITVRAAVSLAVGRTDVEIPDDLADEYGEALAAGAKMRLAKMLSQDWSNPPAAPMYAATYYSAITAAKRRATNALDQAELRVEMRAWV